MKRKTIQVAAVVASFPLILLFQNCSGQFQYQNHGTLTSASTSNATPTSTPAPNTTLPLSPVDESAGSATPSGQVCVDTLNYMGWSGDPEQVINVDLSPFDAFDSSSSEVFAYGGFNVSLMGPMRPGASTFTEAYYLSVSPAMAGVTIKFRDAVSGNAIAVQESDYGTSTVPTPAQFSSGNLVQFSSTAITRFHVPIKRDFFERNRSQLGYVFVELYCQDKLIAKGYQDFQSLAVPLTKKLVPTITGGYTVKDPEVGYAYVECPPTGTLGSKVICNSSMPFGVGHYYLLNGVRDSNFENQNVFEVANLTAGTHYMQMIGRYANGVEDRSPVRTVRVK